MREFHGQIQYPKQMNRQSPFALPSPGRVTSTTYFHYPIDMHMQVPSKSTEFSFEGLAYHGRDSYQDGTYIHRGSLVVSGDHVGPSAMVDYARFVKSLNNEADFNLRLPTPASLGFPAIEDLRKRLQVLGGTHHEKALAHKVFSWWHMRRQTLRHRKCLMTYSIRKACATNSRHRPRQATPNTSCPAWTLTASGSNSVAPRNLHYLRSLSPPWQRT